MQADINLKKRTNNQLKQIITNKIQAIAFYLK